jgi:hypothetical protein
MASKFGVLATLISHGLVAVMIGCAAFRSMQVALFPTDSASRTVLFCLHSAYTHSCG